MEGQSSTQNLTYSGVFALLCNICISKVRPKATALRIAIYKSKIHTCMMDEYHPSSSNDYTTSHNDQRLYRQKVLLFISVFFVYGIADSKLEISFFKNPEVANNWKFRNKSVSQLNLFIFIFLMRKELTAGNLA